MIYLKRSGDLTNLAMEKIAHLFRWFTYLKCWCSIAMLRLPDAANILNIRNGKTDGKWNSTIYNYCNYEEMWQVQEQRKQMNRIFWSKIEDDHL